MEGYYLAGSPETRCTRHRPARCRRDLFKTATGHALATDHRLGKAALLCLGERWPQALRFADLLQHALGRLGPEADEVVRNFDEESEALAAGLFRRSRQVTCNCTSSAAADDGDQRTTASQSPGPPRGRRGLIPHEPTAHCGCYGRPRIRALLPLLDGSRTMDDIVRTSTMRLRERVPALGRSGPNRRRILRGSHPKRWRTT